MRVLSLALFISVCPHFCDAQSAYDLSSISDTKLRTCWEQLFTDIKQISEGKARELYDLFFGKQYARLNSQQQNALDSVKMFLVDYTGYCLNNSSVVTLYPNPNRGHFNLSGRLLPGSYNVEIISERGHEIYSQEGSSADGN